MKTRTTTLTSVVLLVACGTGIAAEGKLAEKFEGKLKPFLGEPQLEMQQLFKGNRFPNVVAAVDGTVLAFWNGVKVRRSEDGGKTWGDDILVGKGHMGGGVTVNETNGDIFAFVGKKHPPTNVTVYRSQDHGKTWAAFDAEIKEDARGNQPQMHMAEHGITLRHGEHEGRLLRPSRVYNAPADNSAIYSDDGGKTWVASGPFPIMGTGEGAVAELSNGHIYYSSRNHRFEKEADFTHKRPFAWSTDGGATWEDAGYDDELPDGPRYRGNRRGFNFNGHFGMMCGLTRLPVEGRDILLYSNADTPDHNRVRMTVWASFDGAKTWPVKRLVFDGPAAYSSLAAGRPGTPSEGWIYLQFEGGPSGSHSDGQLARFNLSWLLEGGKTGDGQLPKWVREDDDRSLSAFSRNGEVKVRSFRVHELKSAWDLGWGRMAKMNPALACGPLPGLFHVFAGRRPARSPSRVQHPGGRCCREARIGPRGHRSPSGQRNGCAVGMSPA